MTKTLKPHCIINHLPEHYQLARKHVLWKNMHKMMQEDPQHYNYIPVSFELPAENELFWKTFTDSSETEEASKEIQSKIFWILKPVGLGEGRGVRVFNSLSKTQLETLSTTTTHIVDNSTQTDNNNKRRKGNNEVSLVIVQHYLKDPLLINNHKVDFRVYVAIVSLTPLHILLFKHGITRFASSPYSSDPETLNQSGIHICNNSVNRMYDMNINDLNWDFHQVKQWMEDTFKDGGSTFESIWKQFKSIAIYTILAVYDKMLQAYHEDKNLEKPLHGFELFGFDILVDSSFKCWLLEVNSMPDLSGSSPNMRKTYKTDFAVKSKLLSDLMNVVHFKVDQQRAAIPDTGIPEDVLGDFESIYCK